MELSPSEKRLLRFLFDWIRPIRPGDIKKELDIKHSTLNSQLEVLQEKKLVAWKKYGPASLTEEGKKVAAHHVRHAVLMEYFLIQVLELQKNVAHEESIKLAPLVSCRLTEAIDEFLDNPEHSPCCGQIPQIKISCISKEDEQTQLEGY